MSEEKKYPKVIVGAFIFNDKNELLLVKGVKWHNKYTCPGGKVETGETIERSLKREIKEETNLDIEKIEFLGIEDGLGLEKSYKKDDDHFIFADYLVAVKNADKIELNDEASGYKWMKIDEWLKKKKSTFAPYVYSVLEKIKNYKEEQGYKDKYLRALADYNNFKKEMDAKKEEWVKFASSNLITEVLPVLDNFKISVLHIPDKERESPWVQGIMYIQKQLQDVLNNQGVEEIKTIGERFNPELHEAVEDNNNTSEKEEKKYKKGYIVKEIKPGYKLHGKIISPARVVVG